MRRILFMLTAVVLFTCCSNQKGNSETNSSLPEPEVSYVAAPAPELPATEEPEPSPVQVAVIQGPIANMEWVNIPEGSFTMGSPDQEMCRRDSEGPQHFVSVNAFQMMTTEVTQGMWEEVMNQAAEEHWASDPYNDLENYGVAPNLPMYNLSWEDCQGFIERLNQIDSEFDYRLPTEAEWEYACRAGTNTAYYWGDDPGYSLIDQYAWYSGNTGGSSSSTGNPQVVGMKEPNSWGLYDMSGNVREFCQDAWHENYDNAPTDGSSWDELDSSNSPSYGGTYRVKRGGDFAFFPASCRSASRESSYPSHRFGNTGFRLVRTPL